MSDPVDNVLGVMGAVAAHRSEVIERAVETVTGGREVYQWRDCDDGAESWLVFRERYPHEARRKVYMLGRVVLSGGKTLVLDPHAPERFSEDEAAS